MRLDSIAIETRRTASWRANRTTRRARSVHIDVVSDVVCPWCYIGKRRLEAGDRAQARHPGRGPLAALFPQSLGAARRHRPADLSDTKFGSVERYNAIAERVGAGRRRRAHLRARQDQAPAQHARLPPADPVGAQRHRSGAHEAAADGALFHRRRRPQRPRGAGRGRGRLRPGRRPGARACSPATPTSTASRAKPTAPRRPASTACPASSSAAASSSPARSRRNISPTPSRACPGGLRGCRPDAHCFVPVLLKRVLNRDSSRASASRGIRCDDPAARLRRRHRREQNQRVWRLTNPASAPSARPAARDTARSSSFWHARCRASSGQWRLGRAGLGDAAMMPPAIAVLAAPRLRHRQNSARSPQRPICVARFPVRRQPFRSVGRSRFSATSRHVGHPFSFDRCPRIPSACARCERSEHQGDGRQRSELASRRAATRGHSRSMTDKRARSRDAPHPSFGNERHEVFASKKIMEQSAGRRK